MPKQITIGHLKITDHLILGLTLDKLVNGDERFTHAQVATKAFTGWNQISDALKSGEIQGAFMLAPTAMDLKLSGVDITMLLFAHKTGSVFVRNKAAGVNGVADLKGKIIAIPYQLSVHHMLLHKLLTENGLEPGAGKDVQLEVMAPMQMPQAIEFDEEGECAGFIVAEPFGSQAVAGGYADEFYLSKDLWEKHPCCVVVMRSEVVEDNKDGVHELVGSLVHSGNMVHDQLDRSISVGAKFLNQEAALIKKVLTDPPDRVLFNELMPNLADLDTIQNYMCDQMKVLKGKVDLDQLVDSSYASAAGAK